MNDSELSKTSFNQFEHNLRKVAEQCTKKIIARLLKFTWWDIICIGRRKIIYEGNNKPYVMK